ncbi:MAG TPA: PKD domain-containing protein [Saprospiraceae bacterium]|nr:PKD domain-containing protein [Saprospiraceae bacterium]
MKYFLISLLATGLIFLSENVDAQREGDTWVMGYYSGGSPNYSIMHLDFRNVDLAIHWHFDEVMHMRETAANICDANGEAILWTNGMEIFGKHGIYVEDTIAYLDNEIGYWNWFDLENIGPFGFPLHDGAIILPIPDREGQFSVLYHFMTDVTQATYGVTEYLEAKINMHVDSSFIMVYKDSLVSEHNYFSGTLSATRHANGRDWWVMVMEATGNKYFAFLLDPKGIRLHHSGEIEINLEEGTGQARFSPQGNYFARMDILDFDDGQNITLFSFDRCTGELILVDQFNTNFGFLTGVAFSPSERYLYADDNNHLWQWDLWASDISASQALVDTFDGFVQPGWSEMRFGPLVNGPEGRIYLIPPAGSSEFIHVIDRPDEPAADCRFLQHHIDLKVPNGCSAPNLPNFRLGPLDGSPCDTLGLNNVPVSRWRFEEDQPGWRYDVRFTDLSFYDPQQWHWDFGDGETSDEIHPIHTFENGLYHVCLTVSNAYGQDSTCQWVEILPVSTEEENPDMSDDLSIAPNPFTDRIEIRSKRGDIRTTSMTIHDLHGREVMSHPAAPVPVVLHVPSWPSGMYLVTIKEEDGKVYQFKVMKI